MCEVMHESPPLFLRYMANVTQSSISGRAIIRFPSLRLSPLADAPHLVLESVPSSLSPHGEAAIVSMAGIFLIHVVDKLLRLLYPSPVWRPVALSVRIWNAGSGQGIGDALIFLFTSSTSVVLRS